MSGFHRKGSCGNSLTSRSALPESLGPSAAGSNPVAQNVILFGRRDSLPDACAEMTNYGTPAVRRDFGLSALALKRRRRFK